MLASKEHAKPFAWRLTTKRNRRRVYPPEWPFRKKGVVVDTSHIPWISWPKLTP